MRQVVIAAAAAAAAAALLPPAPTVSARQAASARAPFRPVTDGVLTSPSPNDWIAWRGTPRSEGHSALSQITRDNVSQLRLVWAWAMEPGVQQTTPLVYDGVMYLPNPGGILQALDAETGDLLWDYRTPIEAGANRSTAITRGIALYGDNVYIAWDVDIIAIDARTGKETWRTTVADRTKGFRFTAGPIAAKGKIVAGMANCTRFVEDKCSLVALDATTGKEAWRIAAIVSPGEPGDDTWTGVEGIYRAGGDMWVSGSYDAELNLVYWSTAQAKPWTRFARGTEGDALYSNTTLAINPDTGKVVWYRQTIPGESHDLDEVFEAVLADFGPRKSLFKMGKMGILWEMDRATGRILRATDIGIQNLVIVDPATGAVRYREDKLPKPGVTLDMCPTTTGVKNWPAMSYSPEARAIYVPHFTACAIGTASEVAKKLGASAMGGFGGGKYYLHPSAQGHLGALTAMDLSGTILWQHRHRAPFATAALATGGGLVFAGTYDRYLFAFDAKTGAVVWQLRGPTSIQGFPISYAVHGRQYIAVPSGTGGPMLAPQRIEGLVPGVPRPQPGNSMMVFALPK